MKLSPKNSMVGAALALALSSTTALAAPNVVASIKPVHALLSTIMQGVGTPHLIVEGSASPHTFSLRPSSAQALSDADLVVWLGPNLETFLVDSVETLAEGSKILSLNTTPDLITLSQREGGAFDAHSHGDDDHDEEHNHDESHGEDEDHDHEGEHDHEHDHEDAHDEDGHNDHHGHDHGETDLHVWLDPENAKAMLNEIAHVLSEIDPENAEFYAENALKGVADMEALQLEIAAQLTPVQGKPFIVFHDAYQYFENRFGLTAAGSITVNPSAIPGVQRIEEIREKISENDAVCVFSEPQFEPRIVTVITEGTGATTGTLDPLGSELENGPNLYPEMMRGLANSFEECLSD